MKNLVFFCFLGLIFLFSCNQEQPKVDLTFSDIEKEFGFSNPLTPASRENIITRFGSIEAYREVLIDVFENRRNRAANTKSTNAIYRVTITWDWLTYDRYRCKENEYLLDAMEDDGIDWPYSCRAGACSTCATLHYIGSLDQADQCFLTTEQIEGGWILPCAACPTSEVGHFEPMEDGLY